MHVVIIGAGLSGLVAGRELTATGRRVTLLDKGRGPGGRLATRRIGDATFDHGAQFFTVRTATFAVEVARWTEAGLVHEWCRGFAGGDGYPRYATNGGMNRIAKHLAAGQDVRSPAMAFAVNPEADAWAVALDDGTAIAADAVIVTTPVPQAMSLVITSGAELPEALRSTEYDRTIGLLAALDRPGRVPNPGGVQDAGIFSFIADNQAKAVSKSPAITLHANAAWSEAHWDEPLDRLDQQLRAEALPWLGSAEIIASQVKKWRFATPRSIWPEPCWRAPTAAPLILAGDAFAGPRVEGAYLSGIAAAAAITD